MTGEEHVEALEEAREHAIEWARHAETIGPGVWSPEDAREKAVKMANMWANVAQAMRNERHT